MSVKPTADGVPQKRLNVDVPEVLAPQFKVHAGPQGKSQRELVIELLGVPGRPPFGTVVRVIPIIRTKRPIAG